MDSRHRACRLRFRWLALAALLPWLSAVASGITVAPITVTIPAASDQASLWLSNGNSTNWQAEARLYQWRQVNDREVLEPADDLHLSPQLLDIPAQGRQLLRVVRTGPPPSGTEKSYRLVIEQRASPNDTGTLLRYSAPVFLLPLDPLPDSPALTATIAGDAGTPILLLHNSSPLHARIADLAFVDGGGRRTALVDSLAGYVLPGQTRSWPLPGHRDQFMDGHFFARINNLPDAALSAGE